MTDQEFERELKKERLKGRYSVLVAVIGAMAVLAAAVIGLYKPGGYTITQGGTQEVIQGGTQEGNQGGTQEGNQGGTQEGNQGGTQRAEPPVDSGIVEPPSLTSYDLLTVCPPYETKNYSDFSSVTIMGIKYENSFYFQSYSMAPYIFEKGLAYFNLQGQYSKMEFDIGRIDGTNAGGAKLTVYLDGEAEEPVTLDPNMLTHYEVSVSGIQQVQLDFTSSDGMYYGGMYSSFAQYGFVNAKLYA